MATSKNARKTGGTVASDASTPTNNGLIEDAGLPKEPSDEGTPRAAGELGVVTSDVDLNHMTHQASIIDPEATKAALNAHTEGYAANPERKIIAIRGYAGDKPVYQYED